MWKRCWFIQWWKEQILFFDVELGRERNVSCSSKYDPHIRFKSIQWIITTLLFQWEEFGCRVRLYGRFEQKMGIYVCMRATIYFDWINDVKIAVSVLINGSESRKVTYVAALQFTSIGAKCTKFYLIKEIRLFALAWMCAPLFQAEQPKWRWCEIRVLVILEIERNEENSLIFCVASSVQCATHIRQSVLESKCRRRFTEAPNFESPGSHLTRQ